MADTRTPRPRTAGFPTPPRLRWIIVCLVLAICFVAIALLWNDVRRQQEALNDSRADNMQWTISQSLVEYQDMMWALHAARLHSPFSPELMAEFRTRYDVFYSRMDTLGTGPIYQPLFNDPVYAAAFARIRACIESAVDLIDGDDEILKASLPKIEAEFEAMEKDIRSFGLQALIGFSQTNDAMRMGLTETMNRMAALTAAMIGTLLAMSAMLFREGRAGDRQLLEQRRLAVRLDTILNTSLDAIIVTDPSGKITEFNGAAQSLFGLTEAEVRGRRLTTLMQPATHVDRRGWSPHALVGRGIVEMQAHTPEGRAFPVELNVEAARVDDGSLLVSFVRDITRRKAAEAELIAARDRALAGEKAKAGFVAMMSHELRTPLNGILGMLDLLKGTRLNAEQKDYAQKMEISGKVLLGHVKDVLDISRAEVGRLDLTPESTALEPLLRSVIDSLSGAAAARGNTISFERIGSIPEYVKIDGDRLRQVLANLIGNAIKFTQDGHVALEAELLKTATGTDALELRVSDTGIGMADDELPRIFEDFEMLDHSFARRQTGAGLGLAIVRRIVDAMDGEVFVESEPGEGTMFTVVLPVEAVAPPATPPAPARSTPKAQPVRRTVLVVEDNDINRAVLRGMLQRRGCTVTEAADGADGVAAAAQTAFDLILMDVAMPGIDGIEAARRIRANAGPSSRAPIVAVTAHAGEQEVSAVLKAGLDGVVTKPVDPALIDRLLSGRGVPLAGQPNPVFGSNRLLDTGHLDQLCAELGCDRLLSLLSRFTTEAEAEIRWMTSAEVRQEPPPDLAARAHKLAGAATNFGAWRLGERLRRADSAAQVGHRSALATHLPGLRGDWAETRAELDRWCAATIAARKQAS